jgi:hypothetical protein
MTDKWPGIERETTPGTPSSPSFPKLWEKELVKRALQTPPSPPTFRQRVRRLWWKLLDKWPLQWKREDEWD